MLRDAGQLRGYSVDARDGEVGKIEDLYFDDQRWTVRYFVVDAGSWLKEKRVLVSPLKMGIVDRDTETIRADLTREQVEASLPAEEDRPLSERMEVLYFPYHWWPSLSWLDERVTEGDAHLRSMKEVEGYAVAAADGDIGHVSGFVVDDRDWVVRYLVIDTRNLWPGKHVLMSPEWIAEVDWNLSRVRVDLERDVIKHSPEFDTDRPVSREYESDLCHFYKREGYWSKEGCPDE